MIGIIRRRRCLTDLQYDLGKKKTFGVLSERLISTCLLFGVVCGPDHAARTRNHIQIGSENA